MNHARAGFGLIRFILKVGLLAAMIVLAWGVWANWSLDADKDGKADGFTFRVTDPNWWTRSRDTAQPYLAKAKEYALEAREKVWGKGGYVDDAQAWIETRRQAREAARTAPAIAPAQPGQPPTPASPAQPPTTQPPTTTPAVRTPPPTPALPTARAKTTLAREDRLRNAEDIFSEGLDLYRKADPAHSEWNDAKVAHINQAREKFFQVRTILDEVIPAYRAEADHDPALLKAANELSERNQRLLSYATKMSSSM